MKNRDKLTADEIILALEKLTLWHVVADGSAIERVLRFKNFRRAFAFMTEIALLAERYDHHPDWCNSYNEVTIRLRSHDVGGLSQRDMDMANKIDAINDSD